MSQLVLRLYITGNSPNSLQALANLAELRRKYFPVDHVVEIVDLQKEPSRGFDEGVMIIPSLLKISPAPRRLIIGNLSQEARVLAALELDLSVIPEQSPITSGEGGRPSS